MRGGPAKAAILASGLTGLISGSSVANTVTTGTFTIPIMKKSGLSAVKAGAIEVAASVNGQIMPPHYGCGCFRYGRTFRYFLFYSPLLMHSCRLLYLTLHFFIFHTLNL